jgi:hypothetical protein
MHLLQNFDEGALYQLESVLNSAVVPEGGSSSFPVIIPMDVTSQ